jgi:hypothetical protein
MVNTWAFGLGAAISGSGEVLSVIVDRRAMQQNAWLGAKPPREQFRDN